MPIYEYICPDCNRNFEEIRPCSRAEEGASCPACGGTARRKMSLFRSKVEKGLGDYMGMAEAAAKSGAGSSSCAGCTSGSCSSCGI